MPNYPRCADSTGRHCWERCGVESRVHNDHKGCCTCESAREKDPKAYEHVEWPLTEMTMQRDNLKAENVNLALQNDQMRKALAQIAALEPDDDGEKIKFARVFDLATTIADQALKPSPYRAQQSEKTNPENRLAPVQLDCICGRPASEHGGCRNYRPNKPCPSIYTHSRLGKLACEKDEAHLHRTGDVEHRRGQTIWMSI